MWWPNFSFGSEYAQQFGKMLDPNTVPYRTQLKPERIGTTGKVTASIPVVLGHSEPGLRFHQPLFHLQIHCYSC
jgi:hypothetical protein